MLAVPNVSEGRDPAVIAAIAAAFADAGVRVRWQHADVDHHRTVLALEGEAEALALALAAGARACATRIDLRRHDGVHPRVGALDVAPLVWLDESERGAALASALVAAEEIGRSGTPVLLYGELAGGRTRAELRRGGPQALAARVAAGELAVDFGPATIDPARGATLVAARPPLIAFNVELAAGATLADAQRIATRIRAGGPEGLPSLRAIGVWLEGLSLAQVSTNIEDHTRVTAGDVVAAVARHAEVAGAELVAPAPACALADLPPELPLRGFDRGALLL